LRFCIGQAVRRKLVVEDSFDHSGKAKPPRQIVEQGRVGGGPIKADQPGWVVQTQFIQFFSALVAIHRSATVLKAIARFEGSTAI
jgi:hypothetical protein